MTNLISNPSFTQFTVSSNVYTFTSWTSTNATLSPNTQEYLFNATSLRVSATSTSASVTSNAVANVAGSGTYTASIYVRVPAGEPEATFVLSLETYDSGNTLDQTFTASSQKISPSSGWVRLELTATFDGTASSAKLKIQASNAFPGNVFLLDGAQLVAGYNAVEFEYIERLDQGQEKAIINRALSKVPFPHLTGVELNADIQLGEFIFNTVDASGVAYVITGIDGLLAPPEPEYEEVSRGFYADGDYDVRGRYTARFITLTGSILPPDKTYVTNARQKLIRAMDLVYKGAWLKLKPANEPEKALFVRLAGNPNIDVVNPRGRIEFSIGLKASDPLIYEWNSDREDGYSLVRTDGANYAGEHLGEVTANNIGNYRAPAIFEIRGPISGDFATLFNYSNANLVRIVEKLRGEKYYLITQKRMSNSVATLRFISDHDLEAGDSIIVSLPETIALANVSREASNSTALIQTVDAGMFGVSDGDSVQISSLPTTNSANTLNGAWIVGNVNTSANTFTIASGATTAIALTNATGATVFNITNSRFNGEQIITDAPDSVSVQYSTEFSENYAQTPVTGANVVLRRSIAFRDADYLEIDTKEREVALNGDSTLQRSKLDVLSDWIRLEPGKNIILLDDTVQTTQKAIRKSVLANGVATLTFSEAHTFKVGDNIVVAGVGANYDTRGRAKVPSYSRSGNVVTTVSTSHGYTTNDSVLVRGLDATIDGEYLITNVNANAFTFVTNSSGTIYSTNVNGLSKKVVTIANYSRTSNLVTISTTSAHGINANTAVYVSGVGDEFDGQWYSSSVTSGATNTIAYNTSIRFTDDYPLTNAPSGAQVSQRFPVVSVGERTISYETGLSAVTPEAPISFGLLASVPGKSTRAVNTVSRATNVATITTIEKHGFSAGQFLTIDGEAQGEFQVRPGDALNVISWTAVSSNVINFQTSSTHNFTTNDVVVIYNVNTGSSITVNGEYTVTGVNATANIFIVTATRPVVTAYSVSAKELLDNVARLTLTTSPLINVSYTSNDGRQVPTQITVTNVDSTFNGTFDVLSVDSGSNVVSYRLAGANIAPTAVGLGASSDVLSIATQSDGKIVIGGFFSTWAGVTVNQIARLNSDGTLDTAFTTNTGTGSNSNNAIRSLAVQSDGKILVGGEFTTFNGTTVNRIVRLNSDGTRDTAFTTNTGTGANNALTAFAVQSDGKIVIGGYFDTWNGTTVNRIVRLNSDGTRDTTFTTNTGTAANDNIKTLAIQSDGKILLGGDFTTFNGTTVNRIARLSSAGVLETTFDTNTGTGASGGVHSLAIQSDGKIVIVGNFTTFNGTTVNRIARLSSAGVLETAFNTNIGTGANNTVYAVAVQNDGKIIIGGAFFVYNGGPDYLARLNSDGTRDTSFASGGGVNNPVYAVRIQSDGKILVGGAFTAFNGPPVNRVARLNSDGTRDIAFTINLGSEGSLSVVFSGTPTDGRVYRKARIVYFTINGINNITDEQTGPLSTTAPAGNTVFMRTLNPHNMSTGDWVAIGGLDARVDGYRQITNVSTTVFSTQLTSPALVRPTIANISRTRNNGDATVTTSDIHNLVAGRFIWLVPNTNAATMVTGSYRVLSVVNSRSFTISTGITSNTNLSVTNNKYLPFQSGATAVEQYAILSSPAPTDFSFSYRNFPANVSNATVATTLLGTPAGEVALSSEPSLKVYYRSAWIA